MAVGARIIGGPAQDSIESWFPAKCAACDECGRKLTSPGKPLSKFCETCAYSPFGGKACVFRHWSDERRKAKE